MRKEQTSHTSTSNAHGNLSVNIYSGNFTAAGNGTYYYCPGAIESSDLVARMAPEKWNYGFFFNGRRQKHARPLAKICHEVFRDHATANAAPEALKKLCIARARQVYGAFPLLLILPVIVQIVEYLWKLYLAWQKHKQEQQDQREEADKIVASIQAGQPFPHSKYRRPAATNK